MRGLWALGLLVLANKCPFAQVETLTRETLLMRPSPITDEEMQRYAEEARRLPSFDLDRQVDAHLQRALQQERRGGGQILASV